MTKGILIHRVKAVCRRHLSIICIRRLQELAVLSLKCFSSFPPTISSSPSLSKDCMLYWVPGSLAAEVLLISHFNPIVRLSPT